MPSGRFKARKAGVLQQLSAGGINAKDGSPVDSALFLSQCADRTNRAQGKR
jgi:hypothetical protein